MNVSDFVDETLSSHGVGQDELGVWGANTPAKNFYFIQNTFGTFSDLYQVRKLFQQELNAYSARGLTSAPDRNPLHIVLSPGVYSSRSSVF